MMGVEWLPEVSQATRANWKENYHLRTCTVCGIYQHTACLLREIFILATRHCPIGVDVDQRFRWSSAVATCPSLRPLPRPEHDVQQNY
ncbi:unnamed protein product [Victoria cruziana]